MLASPPADLAISCDSESGSEPDRFGGNVSWMCRFRRSSRFTKVTSVSHVVLAALLSAALFLVPAVGSAQAAPPGLVEVREEPEGRRGFWLGLGVGAGGESYERSDAGYSDLFYQPTVSLRAGGTVSQRLRLGAEVLSWINEEGPAVESLTSALLIAQLYPLKSLGFYLKGGIGIGRNAVDFDDGFDVGDTGFAGLLGAGYELRLGRRFYLNPVIDLVGHSYDGRAGGDYNERLLNFGLGILVQTGR
jgi:Outer membrane protein beta-barrel domain